MHRESFVSSVGPHAADIVLEITHIAQHDEIGRIRMWLADLEREEKRTV